MLHEVMVSERSQQQPVESTLSGVQLGHDYLESHYAETLSQTLQGVPGVKAMTIGSGLSKPVIRGLGLNRMAVVEDGVKHEGQQWGEDHGLEIDQFAIGKVEVIKGPSALFFGGDAMGGVLKLTTKHVPDEPLEGSVHLFMRSNNEQWGTSADVGGIRGRFFFRAMATLADYADYRVPADSILHNTYWLRLPDHRLRNTAGLERDASLLFGYGGTDFHTDLRISDSYSKSGFFADAHGREVALSDIDYNASWHDISLPFQSVNHLKVASHSTYLGSLYSLDATLAYQNNHREEHAEPVAHGFRPRPTGTLERGFDKHTLSANIGVRWMGFERHLLHGGLDLQYQHNRRDGWGFIMPDFEQSVVGLFLSDKFSLSDGWTVQGGVRYDAARLAIHEYTDWYPTPLSSGDSAYMRRADNLTQSFHSLSWSAGVSHDAGLWTVKMNIGKGFRLPTAKELGADGINYHTCRYEQGNNALLPEQSYQLDASVSHNGRRLVLLVEPYLNFFSNYIYLNPTHLFVEGVQLYRYTQARVFRYGIDAQVDYHVSDHWTASLKGEYLKARQLSGTKKGFSLPFSVPWSVQGEIHYGSQWIGNCRLSAILRVVGSQHDIVPPEQPTDGYWTLGFKAEKDIVIASTRLKVSFLVNNIFKHQYYEHTSYYRLMQIPEPGRNFSLRADWDF